MKWSGPKTNEWKNGKIFRFFGWELECWQRRSSANNNKKSRWKNSITAAEIYQYPKILPNNPHHYLGFRLESPQAFKVEDQGGYSARPPAHHTAGIWPHHPPLTPPPSSTDLTSANSTSGPQTNPSSHLLHAHHTDLTSVGSTMKGKIILKTFFFLL